MKTENLDKLLLALERRVSYPNIWAISGADTLISAGISTKVPLQKISVFVQVRGLAIQSKVGRGLYPYQQKELDAVAAFCEAVIFYYMLKGAGCEAEIAEHRALDVIMEILK